jgi:hypothetical protein
MEVRGGVVEKVGSGEGDGGKLIWWIGTKDVVGAARAVVGGEVVLGGMPPNPSTPYRKPGGLGTDGVEDEAPSMAAIRAVRDDICCTIRRWKCVIIRFKSAISLVWEAAG